jgi:hypothetical protein
MNLKTNYVTEHGFFHRNPSGFLFKHWNGSIQAGTILESTPDKEYICICLDTTNTFEWFKSKEVEILYHPKE